MKLSRRELILLKLAVDEAAAWRGSLVGNPNPNPLKEFDARIKETKQILKKLNNASKRAS